MPVRLNHMPHRLPVRADQVDISRGITRRPDRIQHRLGKSLTQLKVQLTQFIDLAGLAALNNEGVSKE